MLKLSWDYVVIMFEKKANPSGIITALEEKDNLDEDDLIVKFVWPDVKNYKIADRVVISPADQHYAKPILVEGERLIAIQEKYVIWKIE